MTEPHLLYAVDGNLATITLNRPEAKNAFSAEMIRLWCEALELLSQTEDHREAVRACLEERKPEFTGR